MATFWKPEACGQTVLPDRSVLIGQKLVENAKIKKINCDILSNFQTMEWNGNETFLMIFKHCDLVYPFLICKGENKLQSIVEDYDATSD